MIAFISPYLLDLVFSIGPKMDPTIGPTRIPEFAFPFLLGRW